MNKTQLFAKLKKELNITKFIPIAGLSNDNYLLDNKYVLKISYDNHFPLCTDYILLDSAYEKNLGVKILKEYSTPFYQLSYYQENLKSIPEKNLTFEQLDKIIIGIKQFHSLPHSNLRKISIKELCKEFLIFSHSKAFGFLDIFVDLPENDIVPLHFDLVNANILFNKNNNVKIIDYDLSILGPSYLDIVSLLSENYFSQDQENYIIENYFSTEKEIEEFKKNYPIYQYYFDLLWSIWAKARKEKAPKEKKKIFEEIEKEKFNRTNKFANTEF